MQEQYNETLPLDNFVEDAYLEYAMYVILDRALPHVGDGLKPVQRRIIYAMSELGLSSVAKYKKSARTVGDVLGKFHPHGDGACYEAMVLMAQDFSYRYPLIDGQGNWGAIDDPKSFAAMRYTESKLTPYAQILLKELKDGVIDWQENFDGTLKEPKVLPALLPNILLNGAQGIAVGMSTDIPPHNIYEVAKACISLLEDETIGNKELSKIIKGPDFPTYGEIVNKESEILELYEKGVGSVRLRATYEVENKTLVITSLPYQVSSSKIIEQIANQIRNKKLPMLEDIRDESDEASPVRLVLIPRSSRVDLEGLIEHLLVTTDLEKNYRVQFNMIGLNGSPAVKNLKEILTEWLTFRKGLTTKRLNHRLENINKRLHLLEGLLIAFLNIDEVIRIIREEDEPKLILIKELLLSSEQADYVLETKLKQLARLETIKVEKEKKELKEEKKEIEKLLSNDIELKRLIKEEIEEASNNHKDSRRTKLIPKDPAKTLDESILTPSEAVTIVLSKMNWVRLGKGSQIDARSLSYKTGDAYLDHTTGRSNQIAVFLSEDGRIFSTKTYTLPSARGLGEPLSGRFDLEKRVLRYALLAEPKREFLFISNVGYGFISVYETLFTRQKAGKSFMSLRNNEKCLTPLKKEDNNDYLLLITEDDYALIISYRDIPKLTRGRGNKLIQIPPKQLKEGINLKDVFWLSSNDVICFCVGRKKIRLNNEEWICLKSNRASRGKKLPLDIKGYKSIVIESNKKSINNNENASKN